MSHAEAWNNSIKNTRTQLFRSPLPPTCSMCYDMIVLIKTTVMTSSVILNAFPCTGASPSPWKPLFPPGLQKQVETGPGGRAEGGNESADWLLHGCNPFAPKRSDCTGEHFLPVHAPPPCHKVQRRQAFSVLHNSLVDLLQAKRRLDGFWMVQVKQNPAEINSNEEIHAVRKINECLIWNI